MIVDLQRKIIDRYVRFSNEIFSEVVFFSSLVSWFSLSLSLSLLRCYVSFWVVVNRAHTFCRSLFRSNYFDIFFS